MTAKILKNIFTAASVMAALGLGSALRADSIVLLAGGSATVSGSQSNPGDPRSPLSTLSGGTTVASNLVDFTSGTLSGRLGTTVLSGVSENTLGGLTFVYELQNVTSGVWDPGSDGEGITSLVVGTWDGFKTNFAMGTSFYYAPTSDPILPGSADRTDGANQTVTFQFPYGDHVPPIYSGEIGYQLILFTDALGYSVTDATVFSNYFALGNGFDSTTASTFTALAGGGTANGPTSGVPDGATTIILIGLSTLSLGFIKRFSTRA